ncbi:MAG: PH domain-containing protein [Pseudomonadota bacterium]|nr:PH domain-containing protein [Pseudomonadota bacterium]
MRIFDVDTLDPAALDDLAGHLIPGEVVEEAFGASGTTILFTDRRIVTMRVHALLAERLETTSYPYRAIRSFTLLQGAPGESRTEFRIWLDSDAHPLHLRANSGTGLGKLQRLLAAKLV